MLLVMRLVFSWYAILSFRAAAIRWTGAYMQESGLLSMWNRCWSLCAILVQGSATQP